MKWVSCTLASFLPLSAALSSSAALFLEEATAAFNIPKVPKVQNSDADGFPILPTVGSLLTEVSQSMQGLNLKTKHLQEELQELERTSEDKLKKQKIAYDQLLRKQEGTNQQMQAKNAERAKTMMGLRDTARKTQAEIKKEEERNNNQRAKLKSLQDQLKQVQQATEDALSATDDAKPPSGVEPDTSVADEDIHVPQRGLSFLQVQPKTPSDPAGELKASKPAVAVSADEDDDYASVADEANEKKTDAKVVAAAQNPALRSQAPISIWKEDHRDLSGVLRKQAAQMKQSDSKRQLSKKSPQASQTAVKKAVPTVANSQAPISIWKEDHGDLGGELRKMAALQNVPAAALHSPQDRPAAFVGKHSDAMSQAPISMWKEDHGEPVLSASHSLQDEPAAALHSPQDWPAAVLGKHSDAKSQPINRLPISPAQSLGHIRGSAASAKVASAKAATDVKTATKASEHTAVDDQSEALAPAEQSQEALAVVASDSTEVLEEGVAVDGQMAAGMVASLSSGLKMVQEQVHQSEARLKSHFQKAYRAGKKRHNALIKQSEALEMSMRSMQAQEQKLEASLTKLRATNRQLKQKIDSIAGFLGKAIAPISNAKQAA